MSGGKNRVTEDQRTVILGWLDELGPLSFRVLAHRSALGLLVPEGPWVYRTGNLRRLPALDRGDTRRALQSCVSRGDVKSYYVPRFSSGRWPKRKRPMRVYALTAPEEAEVITYFGVRSGKRPFERAENEG